MNKNLTVNTDTFIFYTTPDEKLKIEVFYADETVWLTQEKIAELFGVQRPAVTKHLKNIFESGELVENQVSSILEHTTQHGAIAGKTQTQPVKYYNLDAIIAVGYRVNSASATRFRQWATTTLRDFMIKGFVLDDERLKNGTHFGKDYFEELLERIREIRLSERRLHLKITDIFETSTDYEKNSEIAKNFFAFIQNKLHWAITGNTAAELISARADAKKPNMGLTSWKNSPKGKVLKSDTAIAKNYLSEKELGSLRRIVSAFLDLAEDRAIRQIPMKMTDWAGFIDDYLKLNNYGILQDAGKISHSDAIKKAGKEYEKFRPVQDKEYISDFEREIKKIEKKKNK